jgi:GMP synthase-like glutamine amidotransferase
MPPTVLVLQNLTSDGPGYLGRWLAAQGIAADVRNSEAGDLYPERIQPYAALALLGGEMSANDPLPSLRHAERLVRQAMDAGVPVLGHCLGGQLMARTLGARVSASTAPEVGWLTLQMWPGPETSAWFGAGSEHTVFQWHSEAFELPAGATALATSDACLVQAFALGPHLAMQFHVEVDEAKLRHWTASTDPAYLAAQREHPSVQSGTAILAAAPGYLPAQQRLADRIYRRWAASAGLLPG